MRSLADCTRKEWLRGRRVRSPSRSRSRSGSTSHRPAHIKVRDVVLCSGVVFVGTFVADADGGVLMGERLIAGNFLLYIRVPSLNIPLLLIFILNV